MRDRYKIERELGRGGMAIVFLAHDVKHHRRVAIKVLRPDLTAGLGPDRFLREIQIGAGLTHPHILPLYESGEAGGSLFYVMPYVEGESLRDRLNREQQLPVPEAVRIAREVASALTYAHERGVVHRDIKPENILLSGGEAVVADFGIARAVSAAAGSRLTETGIAMGTPAYMSPEQASASTDVDGRSDIYSLGCVFYEMLAGEPPFTGINPQAVLARHFATPAPSVRTVRDTVPEELEYAIRTALAKTPADRFTTAEQFADALAGAPLPARFRLARWASRRRRARVGALLAVVLAGSAAVALWPRPAGPVDPAVVAVVPFRVAGADPTLRYLREGMIDLLATTLTGEGGPRAADPRTVMSAWRRAAGSEEGDLSQDATLRLARRLGAGRALLGAVVGTSARIVISASVLSVTGGAVHAQASVQGPVDSLTGLVDRLAGELLALGAGEERQRLAMATSTSLVALRSYLDGQAAYRRGRYQEAVRHYGQALEEDSTFALAAVGVRAAGSWVGSQDVERASAIAWARRDRLSARDRALLVGLVGPRFPRSSSERELLTAWERAVAVAPDQAEAWYELGDELFHAGLLLGLDRAHDRAAEAFRRALALDSGFTAPLGHLLELAARRADAAEVRQVRRPLLAAESTADVVDFMRWRSAMALGDDATVAALRRRLAGMPEESVRRIVVSAQLDGVAGSDAEQAGRVWMMKPGAPSRRWFTVTRVHDLALNQGRPAVALALTDSLRAAAPGWRAHLRMRVEDALYSDGDSAAAREAVRGLAAHADGPLAALATGGERHGWPDRPLAEPRRGRGLTAQPVVRAAARSHRGRARRPAD